MATGDALVPRLLGLLKQGASLKLLIEPVITLLIFDLCNFKLGTHSKDL